MRAPSSKKPSKQYRKLFSEAEGMEEGQFKSDLLALFALADRYYKIYMEFDKVILTMKFNNYQHGNWLKAHKRWIEEQVSRLDVIFDARQKEKDNREKLHLIR